MKPIRFETVRYMKEQDLLYHLNKLSEWADEQLHQWYGPGWSGPNINKLCVILSDMGKSIKGKEDGKWQMTRK